MVVCLCSPVWKELYYCYYLLLLLLLLLLLQFLTFELSPFNLVSKGSPGGPKPKEQFCPSLLTHCKSHEDDGTAQALELVEA